MENRISTITQSRNAIKNAATIEDVIGPVPPFACTERLR